MLRTLDSWVPSGDPFGSAGCEQLRVSPPQRSSAENEEHGWAALHTRYIVRRDPKQDVYGGARQPEGAASSPTPPSTQRVLFPVGPLCLWPNNRAGRRQAEGGGGGGGTCTKVSVGTSHLPETSSTDEVAHMAAESAIMEKKMKKKRECSPGSTPMDMRKKMGAQMASTAPNTLRFRHENSTHTPLSRCCVHTFLGRARVNRVQEQGAAGALWDMPRVVCRFREPAHE